MWVAENKNCVMWYDCHEILHSDKCFTDQEPLQYDLKSAIRFSDLFIWWSQVSP